MSANTSITEGGKARSFGPVKALMVQGSDGKYYPWFPESDRALSTLSVDKNGIYRASDKGVYGWSSVSVNVPQNEGVSGKDPDTGEDVYVHPDPETGELVTDVLPVEIRVIEPPSNPYGTYVDGQTITTTGMVVKAYLQTGGEYGTVPNGEITLDPTTAVYDPTTDTGGGESADIDDPAYAGYHPPISAYHELIVTDDHHANPKIKFQKIFTSSAFLVLYCIGGGLQDHPTPLWISTNEDVVDVTTYKYEDGQDPIIDHSTITLSSNSTTKKSGTPFNYVYSGTLGFGSEEFSIPVNIFDSNVSVNSVTRDVATILIDGTTTTIQAGSRQTITVTWPRPGDGAVLETTFDILVGPHGGTGDD